MLYPYTVALQPAAFEWEGLLPLHHRLLRMQAQGVARWWHLRCASATFRHCCSWRL
jgi:hypothetical protein